MSGRTTLKTLKTLKRLAGLAGLAVAGLALGATAVLPQAAGAAGGGGPEPDLAPTMMVGDARIEEGDAGRHVAKVPVTLSAPLPGAAYFTFQTVDDGSDGATPRVDYMPRNVRKKIAAGKTSTIVTVPVIGDGQTEDLESISVTITVLDAPPVAVVKAHGTVAIVDDDPPDGSAPTVSIGSVRVVEGDGGRRSIPVVFALSDAQPSDVVVSWQTVGDTATTGTDFKGVTKTTRIRAGLVQKADFVMLNGDTEVEEDEGLRVVITGISVGSELAITSDPYAGLILITDDDTDTDGDSLVDVAEVYAKTDSSVEDTDSDGLSDGDEVRRWFTNPNQSDTDGDGYDDPTEIKDETNPRDPADHP